MTLGFNSKWSNKFLIQLPSLVIFSQLVCLISYSWLILFLNLAGCLQGLPLHLLLRRDSDKMRFPRGQTILHSQLLCCCWCPSPPSLAPPSPFPAPLLLGDILFPCCICMNIIFFPFMVGSKSCNKDILLYEYSDWGRQLLRSVPHTNALKVCKFYSFLNQKCIKHLCEIGGELGDLLLWLGNVDFITSILILL